ncbi:hypothetical protein GCM10022404_23400 [Celeribacter arenosi]|uniref:Surface lipoprotein assembly modifier C-terminal domain-containing protein n=2 Tax=Celeribacter arenosi TaxID=792649 RepID=A0ABP7KEK6_9RHOB
MVAMAFCAPAEAQNASTGEIVAVFNQAQQFAAQGEDEKAGARFRWLLENDRTSAERSAFYLQAIRESTRRAPLSFSLRAGILPSTNVRRDAASTTFVIGDQVWTIDNGGVEASGIGFQIGATGRMTFAPAVGREVSVAVDLDHLAYSLDELSHTRGQVSASHAWFKAGQRIEVGAYSNRLKYKDIEEGDASSDRRGEGVSASYVRRLDTGAQVAAGLRREWATYDEKPENDSVTTSLSGTYALPVGPRDAVIFRGGIARSDTRQPFLSYDEIRAGVRFSRRAKNGYDWFAGYDVTLRDFDGNYSTLGVSREDVVHDLSVGVTNRNWRVFDAVPRMACTLRRHQSNVALFDYRSTDCALTWQRSF